MKRINVCKKTVLSLAMVAAVSLSACGGSSSSSSGDATTTGDETYNFNWAGIGSTESIDTWIAEEAASRIAEATDGKVNISVYPASQLGDITQVYDEIIQGTIDMGLFSIYGTYDIVSEVLFTPFLTSNLDEFRDVYAEGTFIHDSFEEAQNNLGLEVMGFWPSGYVGLSFTEMNETPEQLFDPSYQKKELLRVAENKTMMINAEALGYNITNLNYSDVYTAMQTGIVQGSQHGGAYVNYQSFRDVLTDYVDYRICNDVYTLIMNTDKFEAMPEEYQEIVSTIMAEVLEEGTVMIEEQEEESIQALVDYGVNVIQPTDEQRAALREYAIENVWPQYGELYGEEYVAQLIEEGRNIN